MTDKELWAIYYRASSVGETVDQRTANGLRAVYAAGEAAVRVCPDCVESCQKYHLGAADQLDGGKNG